MKGLLTLLGAGNPRAILKWLWVYLLFVSGSLRRAKRWIIRQNGVLVLTFHRVLPDSEYDTTHSLPAMIVKEQTFDALSQHVSENYSAIGFTELKSVWQSSTGRLRVAYTFDDGWVDNAKFAAPIALTHRIPLCIFICPAKAGAHLPFWPERLAALLHEVRLREAAIKELEKVLASRARREPSRVLSLRHREAFEPVIELLKSHDAPQREQMMQQIADVVTAQTTIPQNGLADSTMSWDEVRSVRDLGVVLGSHTDSHSILTTIPLDEAEREITISKTEIERILEQRCTLFAYPNGNWSAAVRELVAQAGYEFAFTTERGVWTKDRDPLLIPRINIWEGKLVGLSGKFSRIAFEYSVIWTAYRHSKRHKGEPVQDRTAVALGKNNVPYPSTSPARTR